MRAFRRKLFMGLLTVLGIARRGFFIPYRYASLVPGPGQRPAYRAIETLFDHRADAFKIFIGRIDRYVDPLTAIGDARPPSPRWGQSWFPRLDAAAAYTMVCDHAPSRIIEVGSGHSTRFYARAVSDGGIKCAIMAIDPAPRADIEGLGVTVIRKTVQDAGTLVFEQLQPGDVLSIDSSHILMPGSDVDVLLNVVLPQLASGVLVHIHDIFLPDDYPALWDWRGYNEQSGIAALVHSGGYEIVWSSHYAVTRMKDEIDASIIGRLKLMDGALESSLWLRKI